MKITIVASLLLLASACGGAAMNAPTPKDPSAASGTYEVPAMTGTVTCYSGQNESEIASGKQTAADHVYLRRAWDSGSSTITEDQVVVARGVVSRTWTTYTVTGATFTMNGKYAGGTYDGKGTGTGDAPFSAYEDDVNMSGITAHSKASLADGGLTVDSVIKDAKGNAIAQSSLKLAPLDEAGCKDAFSKYKPL